MKWSTKVQYAIVPEGQGLITDNYNALSIPNLSQALKYVANIVMITVGFFFISSSKIF